MATLAQPVAAPADTPGEVQKHKLPALMLGAIGVVYGDIGTSPLYAMKESFIGPHPLAVDALHIFGVLSLIFWSLMLVVTLKYVLVAMRADNKGEGGSFALLALISRNLGQRRWTAGLVVLGVLAAALFYGDAMLTPAISVLSAVEGLTIVQSNLAYHEATRCHYARRGQCQHPANILWRDKMPGRAHDMSTDDGTRFNRLFDFLFG